MPTEPYSTTLFRGHSLVRLTYTLEGDAVVVHEQRIPGATFDRRVPIAGLTSEVHTIFSRQPAYRLALSAAAIAAMALVLDFAAAYMMPSGSRQLHLWMWYAGLPIAAIGGLIAWNTRKRREWAHFKGKTATSGLYILKDKGAADAYRRFIKALTRELPGN